MALWKYKKDKDGYTSRVPMENYTSADLAEAKEKFILLRNKGVILSEYDDQVWILTKQTRQTHINFGAEEKALRVVCIQEHKSYEDYINSLKCFVLLRLGTCQLEDMTTLVSAAIHETVKSKFFSRLIPLASRMRAACDYVDFVNLIAPEKKLYIKNCEKKIGNIKFQQSLTKRQKSQSCALCEFDSVFVYDELLRSWWNSEQDLYKKGFFYPLYLFWTITTVLPLRVNEFCFTPYDCISHKGGHYRLTIRRSLLKGNRLQFPKFHGYTLEKDYELRSYEVPEQIYREIDTYRMWSRDYHRNHNLLFSLDYMYENDSYTRRKRFRDTSVFDSYYLGILQKIFYKHIISGIYGYRIVSEKEIDERSNENGISYNLEENEIMMILPKFTRHLAMINLVLRGCNPVMVKEFAGHTNQSMSAHYYTNSSNLTRTAVMRLHEQQLHHVNETRFYHNPSASLINRNGEYIVVDDGKCYSTRFLAGTIDDCSQCSGNCRLCRYFIPDRKDSYEELESIVDNEFKYISKLLKNPHIDNLLTQIQMQRYYKLETNLASQFWQEVQNEQM